MQEYHNALTGILLELFPRLADMEPILPSHRLRDDLDLDSLDMVNLQIAIEDTFNISFDPIETDIAEAFESVESLANYLSSRNVGRFD